MQDHYSTHAWVVQHHANSALGVAPTNVIRFNMDSGCTDTAVVSFAELQNQDRSHQAKQPFSIADDLLITSAGTGTLLYRGCFVSHG